MQCARYFYYTPCMSHLCLFPAGLLQCCAHSGPPYSTPHSQSVGPWPSARAWAGISLAVGFRCSSTPLTPYRPGGADLLGPETHGESYHLHALSQHLNVGESRVHCMTDSIVASISPYHSRHAVIFPTLQKVLYSSLKSFNLPPYVPLPSPHDYYAA